MSNRKLARILWTINAVAFAVLAGLIVYVFGQPTFNGPDGPVLASSKLSAAQAILTAVVPTLALAGSVMFRNLGRRRDSSR